MRRFAGSLIPVSLALALSGCGSSQGIRVQGKLTKGGTKYAVPADQRLRLTFYTTEPINDGGRTIPAGEGYMAVYNADDGTFTVSGPDGQGIPPGKYRVSVTQLLTRKAVEQKNEKLRRTDKMFERDTDMLKGKFDDNSPIVVEIKDAKEIAIDLDNPKG